MNRWVLSLLFRILSGEPYTKATQEELRWYSAFFALTPIEGAIFLLATHKFLDRANVVKVWCVFSIFIIVNGASVFVCARFVPAFVSWTFGAVVWSVFLWLALTGRLL